MDIPAGVTVDVVVVGVIAESVNPQTSTMSTFIVTSSGVFMRGDPALL